MIIMDLCLMTLWINVSPGDKRDLFPLYNLIAIVAAMWFNVVGSVITASFASFLFVLIYVTSSPDPSFAVIQQSLTIQIPFLYLVAFLAGYLAEAQEWERERRIETQLLVSDYEREMSMSRDIQKLMLPGHLPRIEGVDLAAMTRIARVGCARPGSGSSTWWAGATTTISYGWTKAALDFASPMSPERVSVRRFGSLFSSTPCERWSRSIMTRRQSLPD